MKFEYHIAGGDFTNAGNASSAVKKILKQTISDNEAIKRAVVALYEAEVNVVAHAYEGTVIAEISNEKIKLTVKDKGPGIVDIDLAMQEGYSTASDKVREMGFGAGMGLANIKKNADVFDIESVEGEGTILKIECYINNFNNE